MTIAVEGDIKNKTKNHKDGLPSLADYLLITKMDKSISSTGRFHLAIQSIELGFI